MTGQAVGVSGLLALLEAVGARLTLEGDGLALTGKRPPAALLEAVKARRAEVLAYLRNEDTAKAEAADSPMSLPSPDVSASDMVQARPGARPLPDWDAVGAQPGHCGSCTRATDAPDWGALMVTCSAPPSAFEAGVKPLALHVGHRCAAYQEEGEAVGRGYRSRLTGQTGQRPAPRQAVAP